MNSTAFGVSESLQILTIGLVIGTGFLTYIGILMQRRAKMREAIEQLDQLKFSESGDFKLKALLHNFSGAFWRKETKIKLKLYTSIEPPNLSYPARADADFPARVFEGHRFEKDENGYIVTFDSVDPLYVRRETDRIMNRMWEAIYKGNVSIG